LLLPAACSLDFDRYDPSLAEAGSGGAATSASGGAAPSGSGGATSTSSSGQGGATSSSGTGGSGSCTPGDTVSCYSGLAGTDGVGICTRGTLTCQDDGTFGPCAGEVTPLTEDCANLLDDDCDGVVNQSAAGCVCTPGHTQACYDGDTGTSGTGVCQGGTQVCLPDGSGYGACVGQVVPSLEICESSADDNCDGSANENCATWSLRLGGPEDQWPWAFAIDGGGNYLVAGAQYDTVNYGGGNQVSAGEADIVVLKRDGNRLHLWSQLWGDTGWDSASAIGADGSGNVYVAGVFSGTLDVGLPSPPTSPPTAAGELDAFVMKLDANGAPQWLNTYGSTGNDIAEGLAVDAAGNVLVVGSYVGTVDFGAGAVSSFMGTTDGFVVRLDTNGALTYSAVFGEDSEDEAHAAAFDGAGNMYIGGNFDEQVSFGGATLLDGGAVNGVGNDGFVAKLDSTGVQQWIAHVETDTWATVLDIRLSGTDVVFSGDFSTDIDFGGGAIAGLGGEEAFVAKLDGSNGNYTWSKAFPALGNQSTGGLAVDAAGNIWLGMSIDGPAINFGGLDVLSAGSDDWALVKFDSAGNHLRSQRFGGVSDQDLRDLHLDANENPVMCGDCNGTVDFGTGSLSSFGSEDMCFASVPK
jgi:hypothetical protein